MIKSIRELKNVKGKTVLLRADFNVPIQNGKVVDAFRIIKALPTIKYLQSKKAKIIIVSHAGKDGSQSLAPVHKVLAKQVKNIFVPEVFGSKTEKAVGDMKPGDVVLLENLRMERGEKENDVVFAKKLAKLADIYVNEAFPVSHRAQASIVLVPKYLPSYAGLQLMEEIKQLSKCLHPKHPFLFILGGAKFDTKMPLLNKYLKIADHVFIGGALANNFFKAEGFDVKKSLVDDGNFGIEKLLKNKKLIIPCDFVMDNEMIVDVGPDAVKALLPIIQKAKTIVWNGPLGFYEKGFTKATKTLLSALARAKAETIIGGGDTAALISPKMEKQFTFVSTGGGATLDFLTKGTLPGIKALDK